MSKYPFSCLIQGIVERKIGIESQRANAKEHNEMSKLFRLDERTRTYKVPGGGRDGVEERVCDKLERTPNRIGVGGTCNTCHSN